MTAEGTCLLKEAVHRSPAFRFEGVSERMFTAWFGGFFYNQIWEDPRVDMEALELGPDNRLLSISSAGCNVLSYLTRSPASVTAVDLNPCHIYLTRLKLAALRSLPTYQDFFAFFGCADREENLANYRRYVRDSLDEATRRFWEGGTWFRRKVLKPRIEYFSKNLYNHARLGYFLRFVHGIARAARRDPAALLQAASSDEQARIFDESVAPLFDHWLVRGIGKLPWFLFGIGIPPRQYAALKRETGGRLVELYRDRVRKLAIDYPIDDNYFAWQAFSRGYDCERRRAVPEYLKDGQYETIKNAVERVHTEINTVTGYLRTRSDASLDRFVFLDAQDWMEPETIEELWREIARVGMPGTRIVFRTASRESPVEAALPPDLRRRFVYEADASRAFHARDRAAIYGGFHLYRMP